MLVLAVPWNETNPVQIIPRAPQSQLLGVALRLQDIEDPRAENIRNILSNTEMNGVPDAMMVQHVVKVIDRMQRGAIVEIVSEQCEQQ